MSLFRTFQPSDAFLLSMGANSTVRGDAPFQRPRNAPVHSQLWHVPSTKLHSSVKLVFLSCVNFQVLFCFFGTEKAETSCQRGKRADLK